MFAFDRRMTDFRQVSDEVAVGVVPLLCVHKLSVAPAILLLVMGMHSGGCGRLNAFIIDVHDDLLRRSASFCRS